ncbi:MAG: hypothetical protein KCHDKBKB_02703 [Elusimicrobia bacterium]|nr:hypothetical protein [Elusimicrobiota bacterium]
MFLKSNKNDPKIESIVGPDTEMEGNFQTRESVRIDGKIKGGVKAQCVLIGEFGVVAGDIFAEKVTVAGKVKGNISANDSLELLRTSHVLGDIQTAKLIISDGANFEGNCQMIKSNGQVIELNPHNISGEIENQNGNHKNLKVVANGKH